MHTEKAYIISILIRNNYQFIEVDKEGKIENIFFYLFSFLSRYKYGKPCILNQDKARVIERGLFMNQLNVN